MSMQQPPPQKARTKPNTSLSTQLGPATTAALNTTTSTAKDMLPPPPPPPRVGTRSPSNPVSSSSNPSTNTRPMSPPGSHSNSAPVSSSSSSRSPSNTPRMRAAVLPPSYESEPRTIDEIYITPASTIRRERGHSTSTVRPPLVATSKPDVHVQFPPVSPTPTRPNTSSTIATTAHSHAATLGPASIAAIPMARVISAPLPSASATVPSRGRTFSFKRPQGSSTSEGGRSRGSSPLRRDWRLPWSKKGRPRAGSDSSVHSVNVAEVMSHRVQTVDEVSSDGSRHHGVVRFDEHGLDSLGLAGMGDQGDVFAWTVSQQASRRTIDSEFSEGSPIDEGTVGHKASSAIDHAQEQEALKRTREKVIRATSYIVDAAHEALAVGAEVLEFAPVPGLAEAARVLLDIWDAVQIVDINKQFCLRLTERCATILISIREEIAEADRISPKPSPTLIGSPASARLASPPLASVALPGFSGNNSSGSSDVLSSSPKDGLGIRGSPRLGGNSSPKGLSGSPKGNNPLARHSPRAGGSEAPGLVGDELKAPLERLNAAFKQVFNILDKQNKRPFLKRYLKRDEIQRQLTACDVSLNDALGMFGLSIQIRILKQVLKAEDQRQADTAALFDRLLHTPPSAFTTLPPYDPYPPRSVTPGFNPTLGSPVEVGPVPGGALQLQGVSSHDYAQPGSQAGAPGSSTIGFPVPVHFQPPPPPLSDPPAVADPSSLDSEKVLTTLAQVVQVQNSQDLAQDAAALRQLMRKAVATNDDMEMLRVLQVPKEEMPQAIKALQRALEIEIAKEREEKEQAEKEKEDTAMLGDHLWASPTEDISVGSMQGIADGVVGAPIVRDTVDPAGQRASNTRAQTIDSAKSTSQISRGSHSSSRSGSGSGSSRDTLDREFIESSIDSLLRLSISHGHPPASLSLPWWSITRFEIIRDHKVGMGFFSEVWRGNYRGRIVAVKVLAPWTPKELFIKEVDIWKELRHPNVLELIGASAIETAEHHAHTPGTLTPRTGLENSVHSTLTALTGVSETGSGWDVPEEAHSPWFFVSRFYERGSLVKWVKSLEKPAWEAMLDDVEQGVLRMVHEIIRGMVYLHAQGILHGDLKCANILINDHGHCVISDFGQSEMKSEACRISGKPLPHGTLRWQAPELMAGESGLTAQIDVYAFAISCIELLTKGGVPWPLADDESVRHFVLKEDKRPESPSLRRWSPYLTEIIHQCWAQAPDKRPSFAQLDDKVRTLRTRFGWNGSDRLAPGEAELEHHWEQWIDGLDLTGTSPAMTPVPLPLLPPDVTSVDLPSFTSESDSFVTAVGSTPQATPNISHSGTQEISAPPIQHAVSEPILEMARPVSEPSHMHHPYASPAMTRPSTAHEAHSPPASSYASRSSSIAYASSTDRSDDLTELPRSISPPPVNAALAEARNERRYRLSLQHEYHPSLILPLWTPTSVFVGDVGYHLKPSGKFVRLFNAYNPLDSSGGLIREMSSINGYVQGQGIVSEGVQKLEKRSVAQRGMDLIQGWISRGKGEGIFPRNVGRRYSAPLRNGHKTALLFTESTMHRYIEDLAAPKRWFHANVDEILRVYSPSHPVQKEDVFLVIGTLEAQDYALFVSHHHPDSQVNFNVFAQSKPGQAWGQFSITNALSASISGGPVYPEEDPGTQSASKVSVARKSTESWDTVLLARLRFAPDRDEPTSL